MPGTVCGYGPKKKHDHDDDDDDDDDDDIEMCFRKMFSFIRKAMQKMTTVYIHVDDCTLGFHIYFCATRIFCVIHKSATCESIFRNMVVFDHKFLFSS